MQTVIYIFAVIGVLSVLLFILVSIFGGSYGGGGTYLDHAVDVDEEVRRCIADLHQKNQELKDELRQKAMEMVLKNSALPLTNEQLKEKAEIVYSFLTSGQKEKNHAR